MTGFSIPPEAAYDLLSEFSADLEKAVRDHANSMIGNKGALDLDTAQWAAVWLGVLLARTLDRNAFVALLERMFQTAAG